MPARLDGTGWELRALQMEWWPILRRWLEHLEWMSTRLHDTGRKLRTLLMGKVEAGPELTR